MTPDALDSLTISEGWAISRLPLNASDGLIAFVAREIADGRRTGKVQHAGFVFGERMPLDRPLWNVEEFATLAERLITSGLAAELDEWFADSRTIPPQPMLDGLGVWVVAHGRRLKRSEFLGPLRVMNPSDAVMRWFAADMARTKGGVCSQDANSVAARNSSWQCSSLTTRWPSPRRAL